MPRAGSGAARGGGGGPAAGRGASDGARWPAGALTAAAAAARRSAGPRSPQRREARAALENRAGRRAGGAGGGRSDRRRRIGSSVAARSDEALERAAIAERRNEQLQAACTGLEERLAASEASRISVAAEAEAFVGQRAAEAAEQRARAEALDREIGPLRELKAESEKALQAAGVLDRELSESRERARSLAAECERLNGTLAERERALAQDAGLWRSRAEAAERETRQLQGQGVERAGREEEERRATAARLERAGREQAERELQIATLRDELAAAVEAHRREARELEARASEGEESSRQARGRLEAAEAALVAARGEFEAREREVRLQLEAQRAASRELEQQLAARVVPEAEASPVRAELRRIQELLEDVVSRARTEAVDYARRDAELSVRLQAALDERRLLQERFDRASAEATERERRSSSLLQSAIDHGPAPSAERANLPAIVPLDPVPGRPRRWVVPAGLAIAALAALLAGFWLRQTRPPAVREPRRGGPPATTRVGDRRRRHAPRRLGSLDAQRRLGRRSGPGHAAQRTGIARRDRGRSRAGRERRGRGAGAGAADGRFSLRHHALRDRLPEESRPGVPGLSRRPPEPLPPARQQRQRGPGLSAAGAREGPARLQLRRRRPRRPALRGCRSPSVSTAPVSRRPPITSSLSSRTSGAASRRVLTWELE